MKFVFYKARRASNQAFTLLIDRNRASYMADTLEEARRAVDEFGDGDRFILTRTTVETITDDDGNFLRREEIEEAVECYPA